MDSNNKGSEWRKWDLHLHSPNTHLANNYKNVTNEDFAQKILDEDIKVIGLTNYFNFTESDYQLKQELEDKGITVFLNLEIRLDYQNKEDDCCDAHIVFSDDITKEQIENFLTNLKVTYAGNEKLAKSLSQKDEFEKATVDFNHLLKVLNQESLELKDYYLLGFLSRGKGNSRSSSNYEKIAKKSHFLIHSSDTNKNVEEDRTYWLSYGKPLLQSSDSHKKSSIGCKYSWIKADTSFEGFKQILFEAETRVSVSTNKPRGPVNKIESVNLNIPDESKVGKDEFCFSGSNVSLGLSPYFNCFIGGRGAGKSTILNFLGLHSNNLISPKIFWDKLEPDFDPNDEQIFSFTGTEIFEFLAQSEIETFARDKIQFTKAIYDRANGPNKILQSFEEKIKNNQSSLDTVIKAVTDLQDLLLQKSIKGKDRRSLENTKNIIESEDYKKITESISELTQKLQLHKKWKREVDLYKTQLEDTQEFYAKVLDGNEDEIQYKESFKLAVEKVKEAIAILDEQNFIELSKEEARYEESISLQEEKLKDLLDKDNFSKENIEQIKSAPQKIVTLEREIEKIEYQIDGKMKIVESFGDIVSSLKSDRKSYEDKIEEIIHPLQGLLTAQFEENKGIDIKKISLEYFFDDNKAWHELTEEFYNFFYGKFHDAERKSDVCRFIVDNQKVFSLNSYEKVKESLNKLQNDDKKYIGFLEEVFKDQYNFKIFLAIRDKHLFDVQANKVVQVKYDGKDIEQASFGQRCTAVVVILLLFGNYPLIIDEPEAHLDSSLIANYLVPLLKKKKFDRQIIFATHNANFVVNGDAEKIFILKNISGKTDIIETTIENMENREELLKLEGGKDAFEKRGEKLNII